MFAKLFSRKRHFFNVCLLTPAGARSVIVSYPDRLMTAARLYLGSAWKTEIIPR